MKKMLANTAIGVRHAAVITVDINRALKFYCDVLEFEPYHTGDQDWAMVKQAGTTLSLIRGTPVTGNQGGGHRAHIGWIVNHPDAVDAFHKKIQTAGGKVGETSQHRDGSYGFYFEDPDGNLLECIFIRYSPVASPRKAVVLLAHGSSDSQWREPFNVLKQKVEIHGATQICELAYLEASSPSLSEVIEKLSHQAGLDQIKIVPIFFAGGGHYTRDIVPLVEKLRRQYPQLTLQLESPAGAHPWVQEALLAVILRS